jgi:hypothetical protein
VFADVSFSWIELFEMMRSTWVFNFIEVYNRFTMNVDKGWLWHLVTLLVVATEQIKFPNRN